MTATGQFRRLAPAVLSTVLASACGGGTTTAPTAGIDSLRIVTTALPDATVDQAYSYQLQALGGNSPYTYSATGLPTGLTIALNGALAGTPRMAGTATFSATVTDVTNATSTSAISFLVREKPLTGDHLLDVNGQYQGMWSNLLAVNNPQPQSCPERCFTATLSVGEDPDDPRLNRSATFGLYFSNDGVNPIPVTGTPTGLLVSRTVSPGNPATFSVGPWLFSGYGLTTPPKYLLVVGQKGNSPDTRSIKAYPI